MALRYPSTGEWVFPSECSLSSSLSEGAVC